MAGAPILSFGELLSRYRGASGLTQSELAERELLQGRQRDALARLAPLFAPIDYDDRLTVEGPPWWAWALLESGQAAQAEDIVARTVVTTTVAGMRPALTDALRIRAELAIRRRDWETATAALDQSLSLARAMAFPSFRSLLEDQIAVLVGRSEQA